MKFNLKDIIINDGLLGSKLNLEWSPSGSSNNLKWQGGSPSPNSSLEKKSHNLWELNIRGNIYTADKRKTRSNISTKLEER